jgi:hypothetical protein
VRRDVEHGSALLTLSVPPSSAGEFDLSTRGAARLTTWKNGAVVIDHQLLTSGTVRLSLEQPDGGTIGSYDLPFASGVESGDFVAPACDFCAAAASK